jgi:hypothetical protein
MAAANTINRYFDTVCEACRLVFDNNTIVNLWVEATTKNPHYIHDSTVCAMRFRNKSNETVIYQAAFVNRIPQN